MFASRVPALIALIVFLLPAGVLAQTASPRSGQAYPTKPIRLIAPFAPGGTNDVLARMVATHLTQVLGETMIVDNRAGAEGIIGTEIAVKARPDGYTLLMVSSALIDLKTPDEMRKIIPVEIAKWTKVAVDARMPRTDK